MKKSIAVVCGGFSGESVVSMRSAQMVMNNIDRERFDPMKIVVTPERWYAEYNGTEVDVNRADFTVTIDGHVHRFDGVFMIIHGTPGENGIMQGYFELLQIPTTTGDTLNMALTFNKKMTTRVLATFGLRVAKSTTLKAMESYSVQGILETVSLPCFVKPNCGGSSIGTSRVNAAEDLHRAIDAAFKADNQIIIEEFIQGDEVTCGVIQWEGRVMALPITQIISKKEFFDYEAKYQGQSEEITPAPIDPELYSAVQSQAEEIYRKLDCRGMIRVDFIIRGKEIFVIEVNTTPGFSEASIIPQQAAVQGIDKKSLITA
ncbi:MAG: D-alanine--D-alanine ligase, partial [Flavobacteriales bacterium]